MSLGAHALLTETYCLHEISKNVEGEVQVLDADQKTCPNPPCDPLTLVQYLRLTLHPADCDSSLGAVLDGRISVRNLATVFTGSDEHLRGVHAASFYWRPSGGGRIRGELEGITNAGTARPPAFPRCEECEACREDGLVTGHLFGTGTNVPDIPVPDFNVEAVYRLAWDPSQTILSTAPVNGTLEGVIIMPCQ